MDMLFLEEVFPSHGYPAHTFVVSTIHRRLCLSLRTAGRSLLVEGSSGLGKTSSLVWAFEELGWGERVEWFSGINRQDHVRLESLLHEVELEPIQCGRVYCIDDFNRLPSALQQRVNEAVLRSVTYGPDADKWVLCGIPTAGRSLLRIPTAVRGRIDRLSFGTRSEALILQQIEKGEEALQINIAQKSELAQAAAGHPQLASLLVQDACIKNQVAARCQVRTDVEVRIPQAIQRVCTGLSTLYGDITREFVKGPSFRRISRAPYFHLLKLVAESPTGSLSLDEVINAHAEATSLRRIVDKPLLQEFLQSGSSAQFQGLIQYDAMSRTMRIEDPKYHWYLQHLDWDSVWKQAGFQKVQFNNKYDFALSFSGSDREVASLIFERLDQAEVSVFYDRNEQHYLLGEDVAAYIGPVYRQESQFVVALLSHEYRRREWTMFEYEQFKHRDSNVITVWLEDIEDELFEPLKKFGHFRAEFFRTWDDLAQEVSKVLLRKLEEQRV
ncbi:TIR domain-containing protein [Tumebacillus permanentifrigoris]|uniref:TIR domain-containing protein n=1 Tax=Tumebacillus permanentifrigoris TaxID=378543 RepID=A0A316D8I9_9BACL|nr:TIR domain-containing protein [Tumebacillus permanentifrigoris]PWK13106.1 TIR domain-containing protein [Tumebacillus permanentifrigoris]